MKFLILIASLSAALGFTYSAFTAGRSIPPQINDPSCKKKCGAGAETGRGTRSCSGGPNGCSITVCSASMYNCGYPGEKYNDVCYSSINTYSCVPIYITDLTTQGECEYYSYYWN